MASTLPPLLSDPFCLAVYMNSPRLPGRRTFLRFLGALIAAPAVAKPASPAPGFDDDRELWLQEWAELPRIPVHESDDSIVTALLSNALQGRPLPLYYQGGSQPGRLRRFSPELVFRHEHGRHIYVSGFCHLREAPRILRVDRIELA